MNLIDDKPLLFYVIQQTLASNSINDVIIATSTNPADDEIVEYCKKNNIDYFRGSENNVLDRYYQCAKKYHFNTVIRITADCPLVDPSIIDSVLKKFDENDFDYISTTIEFKNGKWIDSSCNFPPGLAVEVAKFSALEKAWKEARKPSELEHVFPYVQFNPDKFKLGNFVNSSNLSNIRCTVDYPEDLVFVREIYRRIPQEKQFVTMDDIVNIVEKNPELIMINNSHVFDEGIQKSYREDKEKGYS
jgi:spore coat polysaccharide biosynthesis protein SpsF (cytidylyltransferase family)